MGTTAYLASVASRRERETNLAILSKTRGAENPSDMTAIVLLKEKIKMSLETLTDRERQVSSNDLPRGRLQPNLGRGRTAVPGTRERIRQIEARIT